jgi:hypothetical protein
MSTKVKITVHERIDGQSGFVVKVVAGNREAKFPVESQDEAETLARSIKQYLDDGNPIDILLPTETLQ